MRLLKNNIGENLDGLVLGNTFQIQHQRYNPRKNKQVSWILLKLKLLVCKRTVKRIKPQDIGGKMFKNIFNKRLISKI